MPNPGRHAAGVAWAWALFLALGLSHAACATVPRGRYGVDELTLSGVETLDARALGACLATRERPSLAIDLSKSPSPSCGVPPFDARHLRLKLFRWPWTDWPLYEPSTFERDLARIERWYRARGYYGARVLDAKSTPDSALFGSGATDDHDQIQLRVEVAEGSPVRIASIVVEGVSSLDAEVGAKILAEVDALEPGRRFDETEFDRTKSRVLRRLRDAGYASARVEGSASVDPKALSAHIKFQVISGPFSEFGDVCVEGYGSLPAPLILQASDLKPGQAYSQSELEDARTRIYQMRVFSEVEIVTGHIDPKTGAAQFASEQGRDGEWVAFGSENEPVRKDDGQSERLCRLARANTVRPRIPIEIRVKPAKLYRFGLGAGVQIGVEDGERAYSAARQWDTHVFAYLELRNFFGGLRRFRIEERPKLVFLSAFPKTRDAEGDRSLKLGNDLSTLLEWPAFLEARTLLRVTGVWDRGPDPFGGGFIRDDIDLGIGPARDFFDNRLHASAAVHFNPYLPRDEGRPEWRAERYKLLFLTQTLEWDGRNDRSSPSRGGYLRLELNETLPSSNWSYFRVLPEVRRYFPLPYGLVLATRAGIGLIHIYASSAKTSELRRLGPRPYRLRGGGPYSVRGVQAGALGTQDGDVVHAEGELPKGFPGGTRSWLGSLELRIPLGESLGLAAFMDVGDVDGGGSGRRARLRFDRPNTTLGAGVRYKTIVGPLRADVGFLVPGLQGDDRDSRNVDKRDPLFKLHGAVHITIGEAF